MGAYSVVANGQSRLGQQLSDLVTARSVFERVIEELIVHFDQNYLYQIERLSSVGAQSSQGRIPKLWTH